MCNLAFILGSRFPRINLLKGSLFFDTVDQSVKQRFSSYLHSPFIVTLSDLYIVLPTIKTACCNDTALFFFFVIWLLLFLLKNARTVMLQHSMHLRYIEGQSCCFVVFFIIGSILRVSSVATLDALGKSVIEDVFPACSSWYFSRSCPKLVFPVSWATTSTSWISFVWFSILKF